MKTKSIRKFAITAITQRNMNVTSLSCNIRQYMKFLWCIIMLHNSIMFHNYDFYFIIKELVGEFEGQFQCLGENTEKYITSSLPTKKEIENSKTLTYKLKFIDGVRFMAISLTIFANDFANNFDLMCRVILYLQMFSKTSITNAQ